MRSFGLLGMGVVALSLAGCLDSDGPTFAVPVSGTVTGLSGTVTLALNGAESREISSSGSFAFDARLASGASYAVTVRTQPSTQTCSVANGSGTVRLQPITNVSVTCVSNARSIGGSITGLVGSVTLSNGAETYTANIDGPFAFPAAAIEGSSYAVSVQTQPATQTCSISNGSGSVGDNDVTNIAVDCVTNTYTVGGSLSGLIGGFATDVVLQLNGGDDLTVASDGSFAFPAPLAAGSNYSVTIATQPTVPRQLCTVADSSGPIEAANVTDVAVTCALPTPRFAYVAQNSGVSLYSIDAATGGLSLIGPASNLQNSYDLGPSRDLRFFYIASNYDESITTYSLDRTTGALSEIATLPVDSPRAFSLTPDGRFMHVVNQSQASLSTLTIDADTSVAAASSIPATAAGDQPLSVEHTADGKFAYVGNFTSRTVGAYSIDAATGAPALVGTYATGGDIPSLTMDPRGKFVYVTTYNGQALQGFAIDASTGALNALPGSPYPLGAVTYSVVAHPNGKFVYATTIGINAVSALSIDADTGALTSLGSLATAGQPSSLTIDPGGRFVYVTTQNNLVSVYAVDSTSGTLSFTASFGTGSQPNRVAILAE